MRLRLFQLFLLSALYLGLSTGTVWAHGGGAARLTNVEVGPYWVSVWTQPDPLRVGEAHITVSVAEPGSATAAIREAGPPVLDATVQVQFEPLDHAGERLTAPATHEGAELKLLYEADLELTETGQWRAVILVQGAEGSGRTGFEVQVAPPAASRWPWIAGLGLGALAAFWLVQRYQSHKARV